MEKRSYGKTGDRLSVIGFGGIVVSDTKKWPKCWYAPIDTVAEARVALAFTLAQPVTAAVSPSHAELLWLMCDALDAPGGHAAEVPPATSIDGAAIFSATTVQIDGKDGAP